MLDFLTISTRITNRGVMEVYPTFKIDQRNDLMTRGSDFYAVWMEDEGLWSTNEVDALHLIDQALDDFAEERQKAEHPIRVLHCCASSTKMVDSFHNYCKKQLRDQSHTLDQKLTFSNQKTKKRDYASKRLPYPLEEGAFDAYDRLMSVLYSPSEREKIEWAIGSIVAGESVNLHKFIVLYGAPGTGKSTVLKIIQQLFEGYCATFSAKALTSSTDQFALEPFKTNPLVAFEDDSDLSRIEDNTRLNSLVSHELMTVNEKFKSMYTNRFYSFLFMGTNKPVKITDMKAGITRRLIDVTPTGEIIARREYDQLMKQIPFELGAIAYHCKGVFEEAPNRYDNYLPVAMLGASNDFYNFVSDSYYIFEKENGISQKDAWKLYNQYCEDAKISYPFSLRIFKEELKNYFEEVKDRYYLEDGTRVRNYYYGFKKDKFEEYSTNSNVSEEKVYDQIQFKVQPSIFDQECEEYPAQYATANETPKMEWGSVKTKLKHIDTKKLHYVLVPENHIVIDFDIPDENGNKSFEKNLEAASKWPKTYAELSKSGKGIHLHYIYTGDPSKLAPIYEDHVEIKVFSGRQSLRRKLTKCNNLPIALLHSGLPLKGESKKVVDQKILMNEAGIRTFIKNCLHKEYEPHSTKSNVDYIFKKLEEAYESEVPYDVTDLKADIIDFAAQSTHQSEYCLKLVSKMRLSSAKEAKPISDDKAALIFYDVEVFPNLLLINYKLAGEKSPVVRMINPQPEEVKELCNYNLIGFNCRRYDNHILAARMEGRSLKDIYNISQAIVRGEKGAFYKNAYNISYTDVYDFSSKKQSLKKWEIELGIHHLELGLPWDQPVPEDKWLQVAEYCDNDVLSTEAVFNHLSGDWTARLILADVAGMTPNDTTNTLTTKIIFGDDRNPQGQFNYRDMGDESKIDMFRHPNGFDTYTSFDHDKRPIFPGYKFEGGKSTYRGEEVGEGGWVYAKKGVYGRVVTYDIASMHPSSIIAEELFGPVYTKRFKDILDARIAIKHKDFDKAKTMLGGALARHLEDESSAKALAQALKIAINSVYGLTSAKFDNPFRDHRNKDNIVAKRGALFMINLKNEVEKRGYTVVHVKTDSIKIENPDKDIQKFVYDYGKMYGYNFEIEHAFEKFCLVNDAVYIGKLANDDPEEPGQWTATGKQFQVPYVFKMFTREPVLFDDACETMSVNTALYLDMNENLPEGEHDYKFIGKIGQFTPMKPGCGAGVLLRQGTDKEGNIKYDSATGAKGYLWMESEMVRTLKLEKQINWEYYEKQRAQAVHDISELAADSKYGDFDWFISNAESSKNTKNAKDDLETQMLVASVMPW